MTLMKINVIVYLFVFLLDSNYGYIRSPNLDIKKRYKKQRAQKINFPSWRPYKKNSLS